MRAVETDQRLVSSALFMAELAAARVKRTLQQEGAERYAYAWSGGKDSIALDYVMRLAGVEESVFVMTRLEYPAFLAWVTENMPPRLEVVNTEQDMTWLQQNMDMLFPQDSVTAAKWFKSVQHTGQQRYYRENTLDMLILGRRKADGNYSGGEGNLYTNAVGITRYSPIYDFSHVDTLALMHHCRVQGIIKDIPPIYAWPRGYQVGTGAWAARQWTGSTENGWREVFQIDATVVQDAANSGIQSAAEYLQCVA